MVLAEILETFAVEIDAMVVWPSDDPGVFSAERAPGLDRTTIARTA